MKIIIKLLVIIILLFIVFNYVFGIYIVKSINMLPSIKPGELIIYYRLNNNYHNRDIIVYNNKLYRIVGSNKDIVDINDSLLINNYKEEDEIYFKTIKNSKSDIKYPYNTLENEYFILNDYRNDLNDSRTFGIINKKDIDGLLIVSIQIRDF